MRDRIPVSGRIEELHPTGRRARGDKRGEDQVPREREATEHEEGTTFSWSHGA